MLAREIVQAREATVEVVEGSGIEVEIRADLFEQRQRFVELDRSGIEHRVDCAQARFVFGLACEFAAHLLQLTRQRRAVVIAEPRERGFARGNQRRRVGVAAMRGDEFGDGFWFQRFALQLAELVLQPTDALGDVALFRQQVVLAQQRGPCIGGAAYGFEFAGVAPKSVEQRELAGFG